MATSISIITDIKRRKTPITDGPREESQRGGGYFVIPDGFMGRERVIHASLQKCSSPACHPTAALLKKREAPHQLFAKQPY